MTGLYIIACVSGHFCDLQQANILASNPSVADIETMGNNITSRLMSQLLVNSRHGVFLDSCSHHCGKWGDIRIDGDVQVGATGSPACGCLTCKWAAQTTDKPGAGIIDHRYGCVPVKLCVCKRMSANVFEKESIPMHTSCRRLLRFKLGTSERWQRMSLLQ
jgi:hypothetical protein